MDKFKELLRTYKKTVAAVLVVVLSLVGYKVAPEKVDALVNAVVEVVAPEPQPSTPAVEPGH